MMEEFLIETMISIPIKDLQDWPVKHSTPRNPKINNNLRNVQQMFLFQRPILWYQEKGAGLLNYGPRDSKCYIKVIKLRYSFKKL